MGNVITLLTIFSGVKILIQHSYLHHIINVFLKTTSIKMSHSIVSFKFLTFKASLILNGNCLILYSEIKEINAENIGLQSVVLKGEGLFL